VRLNKKMGFGERTKGRELRPRRSQEEVGARKKGGEPIDKDTLGLKAVLEAHSLRRRKGTGRRGINRK